MGIYILHKGHVKVLKFVKILSLTFYRGVSIIY